MDEHRTRPTAASSVTRSSPILHIRAPRMCALCDDPAVSDPLSTRRRDPAWIWYALAAGALAVLAVLDAIGFLDRFGP